MTEFAPHVFLGNNQSAENIESLLSQGIKYICILGKYTDHFHPARTFHSRFLVEDHQGFNLAVHFNDIFDYIDDCLDRGKKILIQA